MTQRVISVAEFISLWKGELSENVDYSSFYKTTYNSHGEEIVEVVLENIKIENPIYIKNSIQEFLPLRIQNSNIYFLNFSNCTFCSIKLEKETTLKKLYIQEKTNLNELFISENANIADIDISSSSIVDNLVIDKQCQIGILKISGNETKVNFIGISVSTIKRLYVEDGSTILDLIIRTNSKINDLFLKDSSTFDNIYIENGSKCYSFSTESITVKQRILIKDAFFKIISIHTKEVVEINIDNTFLQEFYYKNYISTTLNVRNCQVMLFLLKEMRTGKDGLIQIIDSKISKLKFDTVYNLSSINIRNLEPLCKGNMFKNKISNSAEIDPYEMTPFSKKETAIIILNSDIGKTLFSSDLSKFDKFVFLNSKIIEAFIAGPRLPEVSTTDNANINLLLDQQRIAYNQIKKIYESRGDNVTAMDYLAKEMEVYRKQVVNKQDGKIPGESFQLKFNQFTNQHGTEWRKPLFLTLGISFILYLVYYWLLFGFNFNGSFNFNSIPYYFEFLNPTHKSDFIKKFEFSSNNTRETIALLVDYSSRLIVPLFLYQMIQAFRKYGKK